MKPTVLSNWINPDLRSTRSYSSSYTIRQGHDELFTLNLNKQLGFYQISEFVSQTANHNNFIIEQTNKVGKPKIAAFEKDTGLMLGVLRGNVLLNEHEETVFEVRSLKDLDEQSLRRLSVSHTDDFAAVLPDGRSVAAVFHRLPRKDEDQKLLNWLRRMAKLFTGDPKDIFEIDIVDPDLYDVRMYYAIAVILHSRSGLLLPG